MKHTQWLITHSICRDPKQNQKSNYNLTTPTHTPTRQQHLYPHHPSTDPTRTHTTLPRPSPLKHDPYPPLFPLQHPALNSTVSYLAPRIIPSSYDHIFQFLRCSKSHRECMNCINRRNILIMFGFRVNCLNLVLYGRAVYGDDYTLPSLYYDSSQHQVGYWTLLRT